MDARHLTLLGIVTGSLAAMAACGGGAGPSGGSAGSGGTAASEGQGAGSPSGSGAGHHAGSGANGSGGSGTGAGGSTGPGAGGGTAPSGWLYTLPGDNKIYVSNGSSGTVWTGRGVNIDDIFLCGYNYGLWMNNPDGEHALLDVVNGLATDWKATFFRLSLSMNTFDPVFSWVGTNGYKTSMTNVVHALGAHPNTYVLVTLRSDTSMVDGGGNVCGQGDDAVCIPTAATDDTYRALVDTFKDDNYVLFGLSNEPGGNQATDQELSDAMSHAVGVIRAEEDMLGVPHHLVSVQGNGWTSEIGFYNAAPLPFDDVVYEYHSYPPDPNGYTQSNIPVIVGEYGPGGDTSFAAAFHADVEAKHIPNLAWDASAYSNCAPDLLQVTFDASLTPTAWGGVVKSYLQMH